MFNIIKKVFGTKHDRDIKAFNSIIDEINGNFKTYESLSNDALRNKTVEFRGRIAEHLKGIDEDIAELTQEIEIEEDINLKEEKYQEVDDLKKDRDKARKHDHRSNCYSTR